MGLFRKKKKVKTDSGGILDSNLSFSESSGTASGRTGLLEAAEKYRETAESEDHEEKGLLEEVGDLEVRNFEVGNLEVENLEVENLIEEEPAGLLQKASAIAVESEEEKGRGLLQRAAEIIERGEPEKNGLLARAELIQEKGEISPVPEEAEAAEMEQPVTALVEPEIQLPEEEEIEEVTPVKELEPEEIKEVSEEKPREEIPEAEITEEVEEKVVKSYPELFEHYIESSDSIKILELIDDIIRKEGYTAFIDQVSETLFKLCKGKSIIFYVLSGEKYAAECYLPEKVELKKIGKKGFRQKSKFVELLGDKGETVRSVNIKDQAVLKETAVLNTLTPWMVVPFLSGSDLPGFVIVGNQVKRLKINSTGLLLFAHLSAQYLNRYRVEKELTRHMEQLEKEKEEQQGLLNLYTLSDTARESLKDGLKKIYSQLGIESAALVTGWSGKGKLSVLDSVGIPDKILKKYSVPKNDREIKTIIESRQPGIPKDAKKRISKLSKEKVEQLKTYIVIPVLFQDEVLGIMNIHKMKGAGMKLSRGVKEKLEHGARNIIPHLLQWKIETADPFTVLESVIQEEINSARKSRQSLHFIVFYVEKGKKFSGVLDLVKYLDLALKLYDIINKTCGDRGIAKRVDLNKSLLILRNMGDIEANDIITQIKNEFKQRLTREKKEELFTLTSLITRFPDDTKYHKDFSEILGKVYRISK